MNTTVSETVLIMLLIIAFCLGNLASTSAAEAYGPKSMHLKIHIYLHPDPENADLETGILDINDWPLAKAWIDDWAPMPDKLTLRDYIELGMTQVDINNQKWPTGCPDHKFYNETCEKCQKALKFRQAIAYLTDKDSYISTVLKGYGYRLDVPISPQHSAYIDLPRYRALGLIYNYNKTRAEELLDEAGFIDIDDNGIRNDPYTGSDMKALDVLMRMDDPHIMRIIQLLVSELESVGIPIHEVSYNSWLLLPVEAHLCIRRWCFYVVPDTYYDLYSSYSYYGPTDWWHALEGGLNYPGFCNHEFDAWATQVKYAATIADAQQAAKKCGEIFLKYCPVIPLYTNLAVKAYKTGWAGVVNNAAFGIDNGYTFMMMNWTGLGVDDTIDYGFRSDIEYLNRISSEWMWYHKVLALIYDSMIGINPFDFTSTEWSLATDCNITSWNASKVEGDEDATRLIWTIRDGVKWHDNTAFTAEDVKFSIEFNKICGPTVSWNYPLVFDVYNVTLGPNTNQVTVDLLHKSIWAFQWIGSLPIVKKQLWECITDYYGRNWTHPNWDPTYVRLYDPKDEDINNNGVKDIIEDGTGSWKFVSYTMGEYVALDAWPNFYHSQTYIDDRLQTMFHYGAGDVDEDGEITITDLDWFAYAFGTSGNPFDPPLALPIPYDVYNSACDLDKDGDVDINDMIAAGRYYGKTKG